MIDNLTDLDAKVTTWLNVGTKLAMLRTMKASPGLKLRIIEGLTRESEHANTRNCIQVYLNNNQAVDDFNQIIKSGLIY